MSDQNTICCDCETVIDIPLKIYVDTQQGGATDGVRKWKSDWFDIAASTNMRVEHNLNLEDPSDCHVTLVARVKNDATDWKAGDIVFADGSNVNGASASVEVGWTITLSGTDALVSFGNASSYVANAKAGGCGLLSKANVECRLVVLY